LISSQNPRLLHQHARHPAPSASPVKLPRSPPVKRQPTLLSLRSSTPRQQPQPSPSRLHHRPLRLSPPTQLQRLPRCPARCRRRPRSTRQRSMPPPLRSCRLQPLKRHHQPMCTRVPLRRIRRRPAVHRSSPAPLPHANSQNSSPTRSRRHRSRPASTQTPPRLDRLYSCRLFKKSRSRNKTTGRLSRSERPRRRRRSPRARHRRNVLPLAPPTVRRSCRNILPTRCPT
jgi:hypothetical protein